MKSFKSITWRLTIWYTSVLIASSAVLIFIINFIFGNFVQRPIKDVLPPNVRTRVERLEERQPAELKLLETLQEIRQNDFAQMRRISIIFILLNIAVASVIGYILARQMLRPIKQLNFEMSKINEKNLQTKLVNPEVDDELGELIINFNKMISRLQVAFEQQAEFAANAAHELKTPLTIMQTNIEALSLMEGNGAENSIFHQQALSSIGRMNELIEQLLLLSSISSSRLDFTEVELSSLVTQASAEYKPICADKKQKLETTINSEAKITGNHSLILLCLGNILQNAHKYSPANTTIGILLDQADGYANITISDQGKGIPEHLREKIFERFYRADNSRSRSTGGNGLGLAICREIVNLHHGFIEVQSDASGSKFIISLPLAK